jgi:hypothetical protein
MSQQDGKAWLDPAFMSWSSGTGKQTPGGESLPMDDYITRSEFREELSQFEQRITDMMEDRLRHFETSLRSDVRADISTLTARVEEKVGVLTAQTEQKVSTLAAEVRGELKVLTGRVETVKTILFEQVVAVKTDIADGKKDVATGMADVKTDIADLKKDVAGVNSGIADVKSVTMVLTERLESIQRDFNRRLWIMGATLTFLTTILIALINRFLLK